MRITQVPTPSGPAELHADLPRSPEGVLVLGHGAGGGVDAPDLLAVRDAARAVGWGVVRVQQPWRVAGRRVAEAPVRLDTAWLAALSALPRSARDRPLVVGGRSAGARVACRTAAEVRAVAVLCLAFPLRPPARTASALLIDSAGSRVGELRLPTVPRLVVQGGRDAFGVPDPEPGLEVHVVAGADHAFAVRRMDGRSRADVLAEVGAAAARLLQTLT